MHSIGVDGRRATSEHIANQQTGAQTGAGLSLTLKSILASIANTPVIVRRAEEWLLWSDPDASFVRIDLPLAEYPPFISERSMYDEVVDRTLEFLDGNTDLDAVVDDLRRLLPDPERLSNSHTEDLSKPTLSTSTEHQDHTNNEGIERENLTRNGDQVTAL